MADDYMLGTSDEEITRLRVQHETWRDESERLFDEAGFGAGQTIVDLGCGPGFATVDLARRVLPTGRIIAVDSSERYVRHLERELVAAGIEHVTPTVVDVHGIDLPDGSVDGVWARWLMCFVADPAGVVAEAARLLRPGGVFVVKDYFNYLSVRVYPARESFAKLFRGYRESAERHGGSYEIGDRLPTLLHEQGLVLESLRPICRIGRPGSPVWNWVTGFNAVYVPKLVELGIWTEADRVVFERDWAEATEDPRSFFFPPPMMGIVARKSS